MIATETIFKYGEYLRPFSCRSLICLSPPLRDLVFEFFEALDYICIEYKQNISDRSVSEELLTDLQIDCIYFSCMQHERWVKKFTIHTVVYIFYNNKQKKVKDSFRKEQVTDF